MVILLLSGHIYWITVSGCVHAYNAALGLESELAPNLTIICAWPLSVLTVTLWAFFLFFLQLVHFRDRISLLNPPECTSVDPNLTWRLRWNIFKIFLSHFMCLSGEKQAEQLEMLRIEDFQTQKLSQFSSIGCLNTPLKMSCCGYQWKLEGNPELSSDFMLFQTDPNH